MELLTFLLGLALGVLVTLGVTIIAERDMAERHYDNE
jgi:hypothetical protein